MCNRILFGYCSSNGLAFTFLMDRFELTYVYTLPRVNNNGADQIEWSAPLIFAFNKIGVSLVVSIMVCFFACSFRILLKKTFCPKHIARHSFWKRLVKNGRLEETTSFLGINHSARSGKVTSQGH